jgi:hypothetical protein
LARISCFAFGGVFADDALVTFQCPLVIGTISQPLGNTDLPIHLAGSHGDAGLLTGRNDFFKAELAVAENSDKSNKHRAPLLTREPGDPGYAALVPLSVFPLGCIREKPAVYLICNPTRQGRAQPRAKVWASWQAGCYRGRSKP